MPSTGVDQTIKRDNRLSAFVLICEIDVVDCLLNRNVLLCNWRLIHVWIRYIRWHVFNARSVSPRYSLFRLASSSAYSIKKLFTLSSVAIIEPVFHYGTSHDLRVSNVCPILDDEVCSHFAFVRFFETVVCDSPSQWHCGRHYNHATSLVLGTLIAGYIIPVARLVCKIGSAGFSELMNIATLSSYSTYIL